MLSQREFSNLSVIAASFPILTWYPSKLPGWACIPGLSQSVRSVPPATGVSSEADILYCLNQSN